MEFIQLIVNKGILKFDFKNESEHLVNLQMNEILTEMTLKLIALG